LGRDSLGRDSLGRDSLVIGIATVGTNTVAWNGKEGNGNDVQPSVLGYRVQVKYGEVHFPLIDPESSNYV